LPQPQSRSTPHAAAPTRSATAIAALVRSCRFIRKCAHAWHIPYQVAGQERHGAADVATRSSRSYARSGRQVSDCLSICWNRRPQDDPPVIAARMSGGSSGIGWLSPSRMARIVSGFDAFVTKLSGPGSGRIYSTYLGGGFFEWVLGAAVGVEGSAHVAGQTGSTNFPISARAVQPALAGDADAWVARLDASGSQLIYGSYLGGVRRGLRHRYRSG